MFEKIAELMTERGVSAYRLAKDIGIHQSTITLWKKGKCKPNVDSLKKIADYFDVSFETLL